MFRGEKSQILSTFKKMKKPQSIYRTAIRTENQIWKIFLEKTLPNCSWCTFLKHKIYKAQLLQLSMFPNLASEMLGTSYPSKN